MWFLSLNKINHNREAGNMKKYILLLVFILFAGNGQLLSQVSTEGKDFWLSFGYNGGLAYGTSTTQEPENVTSTRLTLLIRIVAAHDASVTFTYTATGASETVSIPAGTIYVKTLNPTERTNVSPSYDKPTSGVSNKSVRIQSTTPVSVYALNQYNNITDATNVLPADRLGTRYYHLSYASNMVNDNYYQAYYLDGYTIVATDDNTDLYVNNSKVKTLSRGQTYTQYASSTTNDLTGQYIRSTKPIAYFVTNSEINLPKNTDAGELLFQQLMTVDMWGSNFLVPVSLRGIERIRIQASQAGTVVAQKGGSKISGPDNYTIGPGEFIELEVASSSNGCYITSSKPVAVCSYMVGCRYANTLQKGDPSEVWIPPFEQAINRTTIAPFYSALLTNHYVLIISPTATKNETTMSVGTSSTQPLSLTDGVWIDNSASGYSYYSGQLTAGGTTAYTFANPNGIIVLGYGLGNYESYYYLAGAATRDLVPSFYVNSYHFQDLEGMTICEAPYNIRGVVDGDVMKTVIWTLDGAEPANTRNQLNWTIPSLADGTHTLTMEVESTSGAKETISSTFEVHCSEEIGNIIPAEQDVCIGKAESMTPDNELTGTKTYQWQVSPNGFIWSDITGANQKTYAITNQKRGITYYRLKMSDGNKTANTKSARVRIRSCSLPVNHNISVME